MKTLHYLNLKNTAALLVLILAFTASSLAQTPQYYNLNTGTSSNSFPFNVSGGKAVNSLILAGEMNQPTPIPPGQQITRVYFRTSSAGTRSFTSLHVLMAQDVITNLTTGTFYPGPYDTVYYHDTSLTSTVGGWMSVALDHPFNYDPTKSLILFVGQCGYTGTGTSVYNSTLSGIRRVWSVGGCPYTPYSSGDAYMINFGVDVQPAILWDVPELIYYRFENNPTSTSTPNYASAPVGTNPAPVMGLPFNTGGEFDTCITGTGGTGSSSSINTGWNCSLGSGNWTISFWVSNLAETSSGSPCYLFGDAGSTTFRCFYGGAAYPNNMLLRGPLTDILIPCPMPGSHVFHFVYNGTNVIIYMDGVLVSTNPRTISMPTGTGFKVGGYSTSSYSLNVGGKMDEFRLYNRALSANEVAGSWNVELPYSGVGINPKARNLPSDFKLFQNYPNPFNPMTKITFAIPKTENVKLTVYDMLGREVAVLVNEKVNAGTYDVQFNGTNVASGVYFYRLEAGSFTDVKKMTLVK
jgi:hypothetical protein